MKMADICAVSFLIVFLYMFTLMAFLHFYMPSECKSTDTDQKEKTSVVTNKTYSPPVNLGISGGWD